MYNKSVFLFFFGLPLWKPFRLQKHFLFSLIVYINIEIYCNNFKLHPYNSTEYAVFSHVRMHTIRNRPLKTLQLPQCTRYIDELKVSIKKNAILEKRFKYIHNYNYRL